MQRIYLDNNATTALDPTVLNAMAEELAQPPSNPSSIHWFGKQAKQRLAGARARAASFFQCAPHEITFTSSGTESINLMLRGLSCKGHIITTSVEHAAMYETIRSLAEQGWSLTYVPVGLWGAPSPKDIEAAIRPDTRAIALSTANSETGVALDTAAVAALAQRHQIPLLLDAVGSAGKEPIPLYPGISALAISGHKFHAPKGSALLYHRDLDLKAQMTGGGQEQQLRSGTEDLSAIAGLGCALEILSRKQKEFTEHIRGLRLFFEEELLRSIPDLTIHGKGPRIAGTSNIAFLGVDGETLLLQLDLAGVAASLGSACASGALEPSRTLLNMGIDRKTARSSLRFSFSRMNTKEEVARAAELLEKIVKQLRSHTQTT